MSRSRAAIAIAVAIVAAAILVSGGSSNDPRTPRALPGQPAPFLGTAIVGNGRVTAAIDTYGDIVDLRARPAGPAAFAVSSARQAAGTVPPDSAMVVRAGAGPVRPLPLWRADWVRQRYLGGSNAVRTSALVAGARIEILDSVPPSGAALFRKVIVRPQQRGPVTLQIQLPEYVELRCGGGTWRSDHRLRIELACSPNGRARIGAAPLARAVRADRRWLARATPLGPGAPAWARRMYLRALLAMRALTDSRSGAVAAGARDGWAYVWPRDAAAVAIAFARAGFHGEARRIARFLAGLDLGAAARFHGDGSPVGGRAAAGDAIGWVGIAARAAGLPAPRAEATGWEGRGDYGERAGDSGDYLANAIADGVPATRIRALFGAGQFLARRAGDPGSGIDSAVAWAARPFPRPVLFGQVRASIGRLLDEPYRYGIQPTEGWPGADPWTAPTAWTAWSLAALGERGRALSLIAALRRAATPAGALPERVDRTTGVARSTTPLAWSHAFTALALQQLWPSR